MDYEISYALTALITSLVGSIVRIFHEGEKGKVSVNKVFVFISCSLVTGYMCYEVGIYYKDPRLVGIPSIIFALSAVEITKFFRTIVNTVFGSFIKKIPDILTSILKMFLKDYRDNGENKKT